MSARGPKYAFTLLELLLACAATTLLMGGVLLLVAHLSRDVLRMRSQPTPAERARPVIELFRRDLAAARSFQQEEDGRHLTVIGYSGIDPTSGEPNARPVRAEYELRRDVRRSVLLRRQRYLDDPRDVDVHSEVVCLGVSSLRLWPVPEKSDESPDASASGAEAFAKPTEPVPPRLRVSIRWADSDQPYEQTLVLR
jgi:hypothetical protein